MSVTKRGRFYHYEFELLGHRYRGTTKQRTRKQALKAEQKARERVEAAAAGITPPTVEASPRIQDWAEVYLADARQRLRRPDEVEHQLRVVLRFFGARPAARKAWPRPGESAPFHDLTLADPIRDPSWVSRFEDWMRARGVSGDTRNHYRSQMSGLYRLALHHKYRARTGVTMNPFRDVGRDTPGRRTVVVGLAQMRPILEACSYHVRLALAIAALAPKLRRGNILGLEWARDVDPGLRYLTVADHKTVGETRRPLVVPVSAQLRRILEDARRRAPRASHVVTYRGRAVKDIRGGLAAACRQAGLVYGRKDPRGVTFHTLRHSAATLLAELEVAPEKRQATLGHTSLETTALYTHLRPEAERPVVETLSEAWPIADLVTAPRMRASRKAADPDRPSSPHRSPHTRRGDRPVDSL